MRKLLITILGALAILAIGIFLNIQVSGPKNALAKQTNQTAPIKVATAPPDDDIIAKAEDPGDDTKMLAQADVPASPKVSNPTGSTCTDNAGCSSKQICDEGECIGDPCQFLVCGSTANPAKGCIAAAAIHFNGMFEFGQVQQFALKVTKRPDVTARFDRLNQSLRRQLNLNYWAAFSYLPATTLDAVKEMKDEQLCGVLDAPLDGFAAAHLMKRIIGLDITVGRFGKPAATAPAAPQK